MRLQRWLASVVAVTVVGCAAATAVPATTVTQAGILMSTAPAMHSSPFSSATGTESLGTLAHPEYLTHSADHTEAPKCSGKYFVFAAVGPDFRNGIYLGCTNSQEVVTLISEDSAEIPMPWRIMDFDILSGGRKVAIAISQGSSTNGKGQIVVIDLPSLTIKRVYANDNPVTGIAFSQDGELLSFVSSHAGYDDVEILNITTQTKSLLIGGRDLAKGYPVNITSVDWAPNSNQLMFQSSIQVVSINPSQRHTAFVVNLECNLGSPCTNTKLSALSWISGGQHYLSWTPNASIIDAYASESGEGEQRLEVRATSGKLLDRISIPGFTWAERVSQPVSMSVDGKQIIFTYGTKNLVLVDLQSGSHQALFQGTQFSDFLMGKAEFCMCSFE